MSQENVEIVRRAFAYEIYGVGDRAEAEAIFDPQVVMNPSDEGPSYGFDAMRSDFERWASVFEEPKKRGQGRYPLLRGLYVARGQGVARG
jgi:hypothetical protein